MDKGIKTVIGVAIAGGLGYLLLKGKGDEPIPILGGGMTGLVSPELEGEEEVKRMDVWKELPGGVPGVEKPFEPYIPVEPVSSPSIADRGYFAGITKSETIETKKTKEVERAVSGGKTHQPKDIMFSQTYGKIVGGMLGKGYQPKEVQASQTYGKVAKAVDTGIYTPKTAGQTGKVGTAQDAISDLFGRIFGWFGAVTGGGKDRSHKQQDGKTSIVRKSVEHAKYEKPVKSYMPTGGHTPAGHASLKKYATWGKRRYSPSHKKTGIRHAR